MRAPRSLEDLERDAADVFPRFALRDSRTALCLFSAAFHGRQDALWIARAGLSAVCVDVDGERLSHMAGIYPGSWTFVQRDAFEFAAAALDAGERWDVVTLDPFTNTIDRCVSELETFCELARDVVIVGTTVETELVAPDGWQIVDRRKRSDFAGGTFWTVLQPTGVGIQPQDVTACLVTKGDVPLEPILETLPYGETLVWENRPGRDAVCRRFERLRPGRGEIIAVGRDSLVCGRYAAAGLASRDVVYFQDDDTIVRCHEELCRSYDPGRITATYGHGETPGDYADLPLICGGALVDRSLPLGALDRYRHAYPGSWGRDELAYADFIVGILVPFRHVFAPFEILLHVAQHPSRLVNQPWAAEAKRAVTERARALRDST